MKLLQLNTLTEEFVDDLKPSFGNLPETLYKDGEYRLRRYSVVSALREGIFHLPHRDFEQDEELNEFQGGMARSFEEIEEKTLQSEGMVEACLIFKRANGLPDGAEVEIHQMRVRSLPNTIWTPVAPEGIHQDGFDHIAMIGINRHNIHGGELMAYKEKEGHGPFITHALEDGEMMMLSDRELWHNATPISRQDRDEEGYGDWFIFCANK